jgi:hypothetical protein
LVDSFWFTNGDIDKKAVLELGEKIDTYNLDGLNVALEDLKKKFSA